MTVTYITTLTSGAGPLFTYAADADSLVILSTGGLLATSGTAISNSRADVNLHVYGMIASLSSLTFAGANASIHIYEGGSVTSLVQTSSGIGIDLWAGGNLINEGTITGDRTSALVMRASTSVTNLGTITGVNGAFVGLNGQSNVYFVNAGTVAATDYDDAIQGARYNNGLVVEGVNARVINSETGVITAISTEGAGIYVSDLAGGSLIRNLGTIQSLQSIGVDLQGLGAGENQVRVLNWGTISGAISSFTGSGIGDSLLNRGVLQGDVFLDAGSDTFDNRQGTVHGLVDMGAGDDLYDGTRATVDGNILGGAGNDTLFGNAALAEVFDGGDDLDYIDFTRGPAVVVALDGAFDGDGAALGDIYLNIERVNGSGQGDVIRGSAVANLILGMGGNDVIDGQDGADVLRGGAGIDTVTGGRGNDSFRFQALTEGGDIITDFSNVGGNDDRFQIVAANFGGGLVAGALAATQFQSRADNVAQDADDRFVFRTTDQTLWFDADGTGAGASVLIADMQAGVALTSLDIVLI
ncbi:MAG: calcium-binding protein [Fuscovulum sp.]|nr:calcium-binding protein [Fuscovulum sp.]